MYRAFNMDRISFWVSNPGNAMRLTKIVRRAQAYTPLLCEYRIGPVCVVNPDAQFCPRWARIQVQSVIGHCRLNRRNGQQKLTKAHLYMDGKTILWGAERFGEAQKVGIEMYCSDDISNVEVERGILETETCIMGSHMNVIPLFAGIGWRFIAENVSLKRQHLYPSITD